MDRRGRTVLVPVHRGGRNQQNTEHGDRHRAAVFGPLTRFQADEIAAERNPDRRERTADDEGAAIRQMSVRMSERVCARTDVENRRAWKQARDAHPIHPERHESMGWPEIIPGPGIEPSGPRIL